MVTDKIKTATLGKRLSRVLARLLGELCITTDRQNVNESRLKVWSTVFFNSLILSIEHTR